MHCDDVVGDFGNKDALRRRGIETLVIEMHWEDVVVDFGNKDAVRKRCRRLDKDALRRRGRKLW